jgi:hypothetical protein
MLLRCAGLLAAALLTAEPAMAGISDWHLDGRPGAPPFQLRYSFAQGGVSYRFVCEPDKVAVTETGVTGLADEQTGQPIGDGPGSQMTAGASVMGLYTTEVEANLIPAVATPNPSKGWDLTIELPKSDPAFQSLTTAKAMSLTTTGWSGAVFIGPDDRHVIAAFVSQCAAH